MPVRIIAHFAMIPTFRGMAQFGSAPALGAGGRGVRIPLPRPKVALIVCYWRKIQQENHGFDFFFMSQ